VCVRFVERERESGNCGLLTKGNGRTYLPLKNISRRFKNVSEPPKHVYSNHAHKRGRGTDTPSVGQSLVVVLLFVVVMGIICAALAVPIIEVVYLFRTTEQVVQLSVALEDDPINGPIARDLVRNYKVIFTASLVLVALVLFALFTSQPR